MQLREHRRERRARHFLATLDRMRAVHQHFGLDDRHDVRFLAQRRIAGERMRIGVDRELRRNAIGDVDHRAPLGEPRAELVVLGETLAQAIETFGDRLIRETGERLGARVDLDARNDAELASDTARTACRPWSSGGSSRRKESRR